MRPRPLRSSLATSLGAALTLAACADPSPPDTRGAGLLAAEPAIDPDVIPGEFIIELAPGHRLDAATTLGGVEVEPVMPVSSREWLVRTTAVDRALIDGDATAAALASDATVIAAAPNRHAAYSLVPADPLYPQQRWNYQNALGLPQAWDRTTGSASARIAILDTGRTNHGDLVWAAGYDAFDNDSDPTSQAVYNHGVHVAGIVGARANGSGGVGVCWNCSLVPVKISGTGNPTFAAIAAGINWASGESTGVRRADVISLSLNSSVLCTSASVAAVANAIVNAHARGLVVVSSAGNTADTRAHFPADCPNVIAVAASGPTGTLASFSNRGAGIDVVAPGGDLPFYGSDEPVGSCDRVDPFDPFAGAEGVMSTWSTSNVQHCHRYLSGTSMASPHVSGVIGLMLSRNPSLTPTQIAQYLVATARPAGVACPAPGQCGAGMVDAFAAVEAAVNGLQQATITPTTVSFGDVVVGATANSGFTVRNTGSGTLTFAVTRPIAPFVATCTAGCTCTATSCSGSLGANQQASIAVSFTPTIPGTASTSLGFTSNATNLPTAVVSLIGTGTAPRLTVVDPADGQLRLWESNLHRAKVVIRNDGNAALIVHDWSITYLDGQTGFLAISGPKSIPRATVAPGQLFSVEAICQPSWRTGTYRADLRYTTNLGSNHIATVTCSMGPYPIRD